MRFAYGKVLPHFLVLLLRLYLSMAQLYECVARPGGLRLVSHRRLCAILLFGFLAFCVCTRRLPHWFFFDALNIICLDRRCCVRLEALRPCRAASQLYYCAAIPNNRVYRGCDVLALRIPATNWRWLRASDLFAASFCAAKATTPYAFLLHG